jgi:hypothetical protein
MLNNLDILCFDQSVRSKYSKDLADGRSRLSVDGRSTPGRGNRRSMRPYHLRAVDEHA